MFAAKLQQAATRAWGQEQWREAFFQLPRTEQHRLVDFGSHLARAWMYQAGGRDARTALSDKTVQFALRHRLGVELQDTAISRQGRFCSCNPAETLWSPEHALSCLSLQGRLARTQRHELFKHTLANKVIAISAPRMDILFKGLDPERTIFADVTFAGPPPNLVAADPVSRDEITAKVAELQEKAPAKTAESQDPTAGLSVNWARKVARRREKEEEEHTHRHSQTSAQTLTQIQLQTQFTNTAQPGS